MERDDLAARSMTRTRLCARDHRPEWRVINRRCNYSTFKGAHRTPSAYSLLACLQCRRMWRTKAAYVAKTADATTAERAQLRAAAGY